MSLSTQNLSGVDNKEIAYKLSLKLCNLKK